MLPTHTHTSYYPKRASWFPRKAVFVICSLCVCVCVFEFLGSGGKWDEERESSWPCRLIQCPLEHPFLQSALLSWLVLACSSHVGRLRANFEQNQIQACRGNTRLLCFLSSFPPSSPRWVWKRVCQQLISSSSLPPSASQPFSHSFLLFFLLYCLSSPSFSFFGCSVVVCLVCPCFCSVGPFHLFVCSFVHSLSHVWSFLFNLNLVFCFSSFVCSLECLFCLFNFHTFFTFTPLSFSSFVCSRVLLSVIHAFFCPYFVVQCFVWTVFTL